MEMEEMQMSKRARIGNGGACELSKMGEHRDQQHQDEDEDDGEGKAGGRGGGAANLLPWQQQHPSSRICRVSRASGGKDRHSKVLTAKGLRDRRVRLSVSTAIQFYDLQDRLGVDQPSKAVEWLIKAASAAIAELPSLEGAFLDFSSQLIEANKPRSEAPPEDDDDDAEENITQQQQHLSLTKSACSSTSETSKGSVLSLSRSESRLRARERAKERSTAREKGKNEQDDVHLDAPPPHQIMNQNHNSQNSFTDLLTGGGNHGHNPVTVAQANSCGGITTGFMHKPVRHLTPTATTDYFTQAGLFGQEQKPPHQSGFPVQTHFANSPPMGILPFNLTSATSASSGDHPDIQPHFPLLPDHLIPIAAVAAGGDYNLNFSISPGLAGFNRGTLQSNSPSSVPHLHHLQRLSTQVDGSNLPFFFSSAAPAASASGDNPFPAGFDGRLQLCYTDGYRHSDLKGKGKN